MIINFNEKEETIIPHFNGGEKEFKARMFVDENNKIFCGTLEPGASIGMHTHETSSEIIYILQGTGKVLFDDGEEAVQAGLCHYCPKGHAHSLINNSDAELIFFAVVPQQ
ncbi:cupin domain-containing protein [Clostridium sp. Marseille-P2415]|uniref:cupin domain-containing protein n=1 Tax=Clostridium sp. Marseille-P2415 TaxID=1805471 RepID=UPI0009883317|nr:cupin domain-containing protein [Clostridium sp. Marseille-P2415]